MIHPTLSQHTHSLTDDQFIRRHEGRILFGVTEFEPDASQPPKELATPITVIAAATNFHLLRRRNCNALSPTVPLQYDPAPLLRDIFSTVCAAATAMRTGAHTDETWIYTHFEGWLPEEGKRPMDKWRDAWTSPSQPLVHDSHPRTTLRHPIPPDPSPMPMFNIDAPDVRARALRIRPTFDPT